MLPDLYLSIIIIKRGEKHFIYYYEIYVWKLTTRSQMGKEYR